MRGSQTDSATKISQVATIIKLVSRSELSRAVILERQRGCSTGLRNHSMQWHLHRHLRQGLPTCLGTTLNRRAHKLPKHRRETAKMRKTIEFRHLVTSLEALGRKSNISTSKAKLKHRPGRIAALNLRRQHRLSSCRMLPKPSPSQLQLRVQSLRLEPIIPRRPSRQSKGKALQMPDRQLLLAKLAPSLASR